MSDRAHEFVDNAISWIIGACLVVLVAMWAVRLVYSFFVYLWK